MQQICIGLNMAHNGDTTNIEIMHCSIVRSEFGETISNQNSTRASSDRLNIYMHSKEFDVSFDS